MPPAPAMAAASPPSAVVLAAAALAARKSGAAIQGRLTKRSLLSKAAKAPAPAPSPVASAAPAGGSSGQRPTPVQPLPAGMRSEPRLAASDLPKTAAAATALGQMLTVAAVSTASGLLPSPSSLVSDEMSTCLVVEELAQQSPVPVQVSGEPVEAVSAALLVPPPPAPEVPALSWFGASVAADVEEDEDEEVLAPQTPRSAAGDGVAGKATLPLVVAPWPASWVSAADNDDEDGEEELVPQTPPTTLTFNAAAATVVEVDDKGVECGAGKLDGWQEVMPRRGPRRPALPDPPTARRPVPAWLKGRCCRCLAPGHCAAICCDPFRCSRCLENGHRARDCRNAWRPLSLLTGHVGSSPRQANAHRRTQVEVSLPSAVPGRRSWASVVATPVSSLASADMQSALDVQAELLRDAVRPLREAVDSLHDWMLAIGGFLERAEAVLGRLSRTPADPLVLPVVDKVDACGAGLHGCFSPRARASSAITAPVMQIMPELLELCGGVLTPPSVEEVRSGSHEFSDVVSPPCLGFEKCGVVDAAVSISPESDKQVVTIGDEVAKSGLLPTVSGAVVAREVCDFLANLALAYPGSAVGSRVPNNV
ncbi:hypothetical protein ACQ4PT_059220 [Festuca glaucescens]